MMMDNWDLLIYSSAILTNLILPYQNVLFFVSGSTNPQFSTPVSITLNGTIPSSIALAIFIASSHSKGVWSNTTSIILLCCCVVIVVGFDVDDDVGAAGTVSNFC